MGKGVISTFPLFDLLEFGSQVVEFVSEPSFWRLFFKNSELFFARNVEIVESGTLERNKLNDFRIGVNESVKIYG